jgi:hypothetical protein
VDERLAYPLPDEETCPEGDCMCIQPEFHCEDPQCTICKHHPCPPGQEARPHGMSLGGCYRPCRSLSRPGVCPGAKLELKAWAHPLGRQKTPVSWVLEGLARPGHFWCLLVYSIQGALTFLAWAFPS